MIQTEIVMLGIAFTGILLWAGICILRILYQARQAKLHDQRYTCGETVVGFVIAGIIGQIIYWVIAWYLLNGIALSAVTIIQGKAQTVYQTATQYMENSSHDVRRTVTGSNTESYNYSSDSLEAEIIKQFPYERSFWFAVTMDKNGNVTGAYFTHHELSAKEFRRANKEEQKLMMLNPQMGEDAVVGAWTILDQKHQENMWGIQLEEETS